MKIILATGNQGKLVEIAQVFSALDVEIIAQAEFGIDSPPETGNTFVANALQKARHAAAQSGLPAMADDSGLVVDALGGRPGIYSARYAGADATDDENVNWLLDELDGVREEDRGAGFHCAAVFVTPDAGTEPLISEAVWRGRILDHRAGTDGFGYDPVFFDPHIGKTGAQMSRAEKNSRSHRGMAFRQLYELLKAKL